MKVYEHLMAVREETKDPYSGICAHMFPRNMEGRSPWFTMRQEAVKSWGGYDDTFGTNYPVGGNMEYNECHDLWKNPRRWDLLNHLINWYKERDL